MPMLGAAGLLAFASGASAESPVDTSTTNTGVSDQAFLGEEEISDVSLATFYVFDKENAGSLEPGVQFARLRLWPRLWGWLQRPRSWLWWRLQRRLRLWGLRRLWMRRMRPGLVGSLRRRLLHCWGG